MTLILAGVYARQSVVTPLNQQTGALPIVGNPEVSVGPDLPGAIWQLQIGHVSRELPRLKSGT